MRERERERARESCSYLPPRIDHSTALLADYTAVPVPCIRIDRLTDRTNDTQRRQVASRHPLVAQSLQGTNRGRRRVELVDLVLFTHLPVAAVVGMRRNSLKLAHTSVNRRFTRASKRASERTSERTSQREHTNTLVARFNSGPYKMYECPVIHPMSAVHQ